MRPFAAPLQPVPIDWSGLGQSIVDALVHGVQTLLSPLPLEFIEWLLSSLQSILSAQGPLNMLTHVPLEVTAYSDEVLGLWRQLLLTQAALCALVLVFQGYRVVHGTLDLWDALFETGFRVIVGQSLIWWAALVLGAINSAADFVTQTPFDIRTQQLPADLVIGLMLVFATFLSGLAWVKGAAGALFIGVLLVSGPFIITLSALPMLGGLGRWWAEEFTTWALRGFMVALVLRLGLGIGVHHQGGLQMLLACVAFWLAYKMDTHLRRFSVGAWGSMSNLGLLSRGARLAAGAFGGGAAAPVAAAASAAP